MYQIEVKDNSKEKVFVFCPSVLSVKEWIYTQLLNAMHEDLKYHTTLATTADIMECYRCAFGLLQQVDEDELTSVSFSTYHNVEYVVKYQPDGNLKLVNFV